MKYEKVSCECHLVCRVSGQHFHVPTEVCIPLPLAVEAVAIVYLSDKG